MDEKIDQAIQNVLAMIRANVKHDEAMKLSQAVLNLAHAKDILKGKTTRTKGTGAT